MKTIINKVFIRQSDKTFYQLIRYFFVGGTAFIVDFGILYLMTEYLKVHYLVSACVGFILGLTVNYILSIKWVFNRRRIGKTSIEFILFGLLGIIGLALNELFLWGLTDGLHLHYLISKIITTFIIYLWNFFSRKYLLFN